MNEFGHFSLCLAWLLALLGCAGAVYSAKRKSLRWLTAAGNATLACALCCGLSVGALAFGFLTDDFANQYVWQYSNRDMQRLYKFTAVWGGMDGSMLLWAFILSVAGGAVALRRRNYKAPLMSWFLAVLNSCYLFFLTVVVFLTNPFRYLQTDFVPPDGNGLNPLLQNIYMALHPPLLYAGFTGFAIPFSFCLAALLAGKLSTEWLNVTRRWTLIAWGFLTAGIVLGGYWAYIELGWGGFWAWDPVENASFLPWLTGTALLHSLIVQARRNSLKLWNVWLIVLTYALTVFGTFLTRSGIVQSVHSFASTNIGWIFLLYLGLIFAATAALSLYRMRLLQAETRIQSLFSREAAFLINNLVFIGIAFATLWGVMFPIFSEALTGKKQAVAVPYFNAINGPLFLFMVFLMGVGPMLGWGRTAPLKLVRLFVLPAAVSAAAGGALVLLAGISILAALAYALCLFALIKIVEEFLRDLAAARARAAGGSTVAAALNLWSRQRRRYASHLSHLGVLLMAAAITAASAHKTEKDFSLARGESLTVGGYVFTLNGVQERQSKNFSSLVSAMNVRAEDGRQVAILQPEMRYYPQNRQSTSEVSLHSGALQDVYVVMVEYNGQADRAAFKLFINPLQVWLWVGTLVMMLGAALSLIPRPPAKTAPAPQRAAAGDALQAAEGVS